jgi:hypothetical protein
MMTAWVGVFVVCVLMDFVWARYIHHTAKGNAFKAALWSVAVLVLSGLSIIAYTENHLLLIPSAGGCFVGTYLATSRPLAKLVAAVRRA